MLTLSEGSAPGYCTAALAGPPWFCLTGNISLTADMRAPARIALSSPRLPRGVSAMPRGGVV
ncbi:MAG: hypothetical protein ACI30K_03795 [Muribaculaceae bacterium]